MPEETISSTSISFRKIASITIILILSFVSFQVVLGAGLTPPEYEDWTSHSYFLNRESHQEFLQEWTQSTSSQFEEGEVDDTLLTEGNEVKLDTYVYVIGSAEMPDDPRGGYWSAGWTSKTGRSDYQASRGGTIDKFRMAVDEYASAFDLRVLKPTGNPNEFYVDEPDGSITLDPEPFTITTWHGVDVPINQNDWIGIYTYGDLSALSEKSGDWSVYGYEGKIGSTPQTMQEFQDPIIHTMEAEIITHREEGVLVSSVHDCGESIYEWDTISWGGEEPEGTDFTIETRTSPDNVVWSNWEVAENGGEVPSPLDRFIQYRATFEAYEGSYTPILDWITVRYLIDEAPPNIEHTELDEFQKDGAYIVDATVTDEYSGINEDSVALYYRKDGGVWNSVSMNTTDEMDVYVAEIPDQSTGVVDYYIYAEDEKGSFATSPEEAPHYDYYSFLVDKEPPITSISLDGEEGEGGWFTSEVSVVLQVDDLSLSPIDYTRYRIDSGSWQYYDGSFILSEGGEYVVEFYSTDILDNVESTNTREIKIDTNTPVTTYNLEGDEGLNDWYMDDVTVELEAFDDISGVEYIRYRINEQSWIDYTGPITVSESGEHTLEFYSADQAGNEDEVHMIEIKIDKTDPSIGESVSGTLGNGGWYTSDVEMELFAAEDISGIDSIYYRINLGPWENYGNGILLDEGVHIVEYYAENNAGRSSAVNSLQVRIDKTPPTLNVSLPDILGEWYSQPPEITILAEDDLSGVDTIEYRLDPETDWQIYEGTFVCDEVGRIEMEVRCYDTAGNIAEKVVSFSVDDMPPTLREHYYSNTIWNRDMEVKADAIDYYSGISNVYLHYNTGNGWREIPMRLEGGEYVATIPGEDIGFSSSLEYYIEVIDNAGNVMESERTKASVGVYFAPTPTAKAVGMLASLGGDEFVAR